MYFARRFALMLLSLALATVACQNEETGSAQFAVSMTQALSAGSVTRVTVTSSGPSIPSITTELVKTGGVWSGVIGNIPAGSNREFRARAFNSGNVLLFEGTAPGVTISANQNTLVAITLQEMNPSPPFSNEAPIIQSVVATPTTVQTGGTASLQATVQDPNPGDSLSYAWTASAGSLSNPTHPSAAWAAPATPGFVTLTLTVSDSRGASSSVTLAVNVVNGSGEGSAVLDVRFNSWPVVSALSASATLLDVGQSTTLTATAADSDGDALAYQWASSCTGSWTNSTSSTAAFAPSALPSGACNNCQLTITVTDGRGGQTIGTVALCVASTTTNRFPPTIAHSYQSSLAAQPSQQLTFEVTASDPQNSSLTFSWSATTGTSGAAQNSANTSRIDWTAPACVSAAPLASITATVTNTHGLSTTRAFGVTGLPLCSGWSPAGSMASVRYGHTATLLSNGKILMAGGTNGVYLASAEVYDPGTGIGASTGSTASARYGHTATLLSNGKVLVAGGHSGSGILATAEVYDPGTGTWTSTGSMASTRYTHTATLLPNGKVLVSGGWNGSYLFSTEVYDPGTGTWTSTGSMASARRMHTATLLPNGRVLVSGGRNSNSNILASAEVYDPGTGTWTSTGSLASARYSHTATLLSNGKVLVAGGGDSILLSSAEVYDPVTGTWASTGSMASTRWVHTATHLSNGKILVAGGMSSGDLSSAEVYDPVTGTWASTGSMTSARYGHAATLLNNGNVLVSGGDNGSSILATAEVYTP